MLDMNKRPEPEVRSVAEAMSAGEKFAADRNEKSLAISWEDFAAEMTERAKDIGTLVAGKSPTERTLFLAAFFGGALAAFDLLENQIEGRDEIGQFMVKFAVQYGKKAKEILSARAREEG